MLKPLPPPWDRFVPFLQKTMVWAMFFGILWLLRPFFLLVFLTFVFGYIMEHLVEKLEGKIPSRRFRVVLSFLALLAVLVGIGTMVGPALGRQVRTFVGDLDKHRATVDKEIQRLREESEAIASLIPEDVRSQEIVGAIFGREVERSEALGEEARVAGAEPGERRREGDQWKAVLPHVIALLGRSIEIGSAFLLSLLFSFLIVLDFPNLAKGARALRDTRARFVYEEVSDNIFHFGRTLGRALEAQLFIAILNTALTAIGLSLMGFPNLAFLSSIVFVCSFIPVAGVFISSVPICLQALTDKGPVMMLWVIAFITVVHMIEAYVLNPRIYGAHLRMNPVLVLAILVIAHHLIGMWGLVLGVPVITYVYKHVILGRNGDEPSEKGMA